MSRAVDARYLRSDRVAQRQRATVCARVIGPFLISEFAAKPVSVQSRVQSSTRRSSRGAQHDLWVGLQIFPSGVNQPV